MFPCEMARYIAGFSPEARKLGRILQGWRACRRAWKANVGEADMAASSGIPASASTASLSIIIPKTASPTPDLAHVEN
jgi:hypothetical protein